jgi:hypothetical protein
MQVIGIKELLRKTKGVTEEEVREVVEMIREVEKLGVTRSEYNLAPPFSGLRVRAQKGQSR